MAIPISRLPDRRLFLALASLFLALSCSQGPRGGILALESPPELRPRLEELLAARPLPRGWIVGAEGAEALLDLAALPPGGALPRGARVSGNRYLAASVGLADERYSESPLRARELGLEALESIVLPRRALAVDGLWPGAAGYPFAQRLVASIHPAGSARVVPRSLAAWLEAAAAAALASERRPIDLAAAGDLQVGEYQWPLLSGSEAGLGSLLRDGVLDLVRKPDISVVNLEAPISAGGFPNPRKRFKFRMPPGSAAALRNAGFDLVLFGNNHGLDYGVEAFFDTLADLESAGLPMAGAGRDLAEASAPRFLDAGAGERLAFVGYAFYPDERMGFTSAEAAAGRGRPGVASDEAAALESLRSAAASGATVVVLAHGGAEYVEEPRPYVRELYARFVDAGAALILGSHPHLLQGCEARSGSLIAYSLGNFLFTGELEPPEALRSAILSFLVYRGRVRGLMISPVIAGYDFTTVDEDRAGAEARLSRLSAGLADAP